MTQDISGEAQDNWSTNEASYIRGSLRTTHTRNKKSKKKKKKKQFFL